MTDDADWVLLVECNTMAELHTLRATLEARGVPCRVHGEHTHGVLGPIHGAVARPRVLVPRRALGVARALAEDIVGPFDERPEPEDAAADASPFRTSAELAPGDDDDADDDDADDDASPDDALAERRGPRALRPRSYGALVLIACIGGPFLGLSHLYVRRNVQAAILATLSVISIVALLKGATWPPLVLAAVALLDLLGGMLGVAAYNRGLAALPAAAPTPAKP